MTASDVLWNYNWSARKAAQAREEAARHDQDAAKHQESLVEILGQLGPGEAVECNNSAYWLEDGKVVRRTLKTTYSLRDEVEEEPEEVTAEVA